MTLLLEQQTNILKNPFIAFLKLIRFENLLILVFTQYLMRYAVMNSLLYYKGQKINLQLSHFNFFLLSLSTVVIAAAGYIINDYFDVKTDKINRPSSVVIDKGIKRRVAMAAHLVLNCVGVALGIYVAIVAGNYKLGIIHVLSAGLLWNYSTIFKKQLIIGNVIVSVLTALVPLIVLFYESPSIINYCKITWPDNLGEINQLYKFICKYIFAFSGFAFLTSMIREIIKDMEDFQGDKETGCNTIPIAWGMRAAKAIVVGLISNTLILLFFITYKLYNSPSDTVPTLYILIAVVLPLMLLCYKIYKAQTPHDFKKASFLVKIIMLTGVSFSFIIYYLSNYATG